MPWRGSTFGFPVETLRGDPTVHLMLELIEDRKAHDMRGGFRGKLLELGQAFCDLSDESGSGVFGLQLVRRVLTPPSPFRQYSLV